MLAHRFLPYFPDFQLQALLIGKGFDVLDLNWTISVLVDRKNCFLFRKCFKGFFEDFQIILIFWRRLKYFWTFRKQVVLNFKFVLCTWNSLVSFAVGNMPHVFSNSMTKVRRCSSTLRCPFSLASCVFGVRGERSACSAAEALAEAATKINTC